MASINHQSEDGGGDGCRTTARSGVVSPARITVVSDERGELSPPVVSDTSVSSPVETSSLSSLIQEQTVDGSTDTANSSDSGGGGANAVKKQVWSKPSNVVEVVSPVMDAASWPALGESTRAVRSSSSLESLQALSDGSLLPALQVTVNSSPSHKPASVNPALTPKHVARSEQSSIRQGGGASGVYLSSTGGFSQRSPASQESEVESVDNPPVKPAIVLDPYSKDHTYKEPPQGVYGSQPNSGIGQGNAYKRGYGGPHPRSHGYGHGWGRGYQEWNQHRNFNNMDTNMQPQRGGYHRGGYRQAAHKSTPFVHPPMPVPVRPFGSNVLYPDVANGMVYFLGPPPPTFPWPIYFPVPDPLHDKIMKQIDFYFSIDNLVKDTYLRRYMDEQGWIPVNLIAGFSKVSCLTDNVQLILDVMKKSTVVEVQRDKMRRRNDWMRWLMPPAVQDSLGSQLQGIGLDEGCSLQPGGGDRPPVA